MQRGKLTKPKVIVQRLSTLQRRIAWLTEQGLLLARALGSLIVFCHFALLFLPFRNALDPAVFLLFHRLLVRLKFYISNGSRATGNTAA